MDQAYRRVSRFIKDNPDWSLVIEDFLYNLDDPEKHSTELDVMRRTLMRDGINKLDRDLRDWEEKDNDIE